MRDLSMKLAVLGLAGMIATTGRAQEAPVHDAATKTVSSEPWKRIAIPPLHAFKPVQPRRIELTNGLVILLEEDHELPFINGRILIRGGSRDEPAAKVGLVSLYGQTWRTSGMTAVNGDALDDQLDAKAAESRDAKR
jgi:zinc protease